MSHSSHGPVPARTRGLAHARAQVSAISRGVTLRTLTYIHAEQAAGIGLFIGAALALLWANSPWAASYAALWNIDAVVHIGSFHIEHTLQEWVNDGLMFFFFLLVGLEIKRELVDGELASLRKAALPIGAAIGGMVVPAGLYALLNVSGPGARGWGIPVATDIAFALGVLALLGRRLPSSLRIFLLALATVDDIGGILIIAIFYASGISWTALSVAGGLVLTVFILRRFALRNPGVIVVLGFALWLAVLKSGIHPTIAGVVLGLLTPARRFVEPRAARDTMHDINTQLDEAIDRGDAEKTDLLLGTLEEVVRNTEQPLERTERLLRPWIGYVVLPVFALANAGVVLSGEAFAQAVHSSVAQGIAVGLLAGKLVGIAGATWLTVRLRLGDLPRGVTWSHVVGTALLAGIGFTVSIFIASLAFPAGAELQQAKLAILIVSIVAAILGAGLLLLRSRRQPVPVPG